MLSKIDAQIGIEQKSFRGGPSARKDLGLGPGGGKGGGGSEERKKRRKEEGN